MKVVELNSSNIDVYKNLAHAYEAEFSNLTGNLPDQAGIFHPDTMPFEPYIGFLLYHENVPSGFCVAHITETLHNISEFYVVPVKRRQQVGSFLAKQVFHKFPGKWQVKQIKGADQAIAFWRKVIGKVTNNHFEESLKMDEKWGNVTCQEFRI